MPTLTASSASFARAPGSPASPLNAGNILRRGRLRQVQRRESCFPPPRSTRSLATSCMPHKGIHRKPGDGQRGIKAKETSAGAGCGGRAAGRAPPGARGPRRGRPNANTARSVKYLKILHDLIAEYILTGNRACAKNQYAFRSGRCPNAGAYRNVLASCQTAQAKGYRSRGGGCRHGGKEAY